MAPGHIDIVRQIIQIDAGDTCKTPHKARQKQAKRSSQNVRLLLHTFIRYAVFTACLPSAFNDAPETETDTERESVAKAHALGQW